MSNDNVNVFQTEPFRWQGIEELIYKDEDGNPSFKDVTRHKLFSESDPQGFEVRYFEVSPGGHTTLEKHEHIHIVIPIRGSGFCLVGTEIVKLEVNNLLHVPSWQWHQFRATENDSLGFMCFVKVERDRPTLPTNEEINKLKENKAIAEFIRIKN